MEKILLGHGSGGKLMHRLLDELIFKEFDNDILRENKDAAVLDRISGRVAFTTDSYVVDPIIFPGGDIGSLAIYGTVNDLSVVGARPLYISVGVIIEEGLDWKILERVVKSMAKAAFRCGVKIVTGDTKVVERGSCDKIFINTSGIGQIYYEGLSLDKIKVGDNIIISGPIGEHAISVLSQREGIRFSSSIKSDSGPLNVLIERALRVSGKVRFMRDPTRGGVATTLNEMVSGGDFGIALDECMVPVSGAVEEAAELLGLDPLYLACEGRVIAVVAPDDTAKVLSAMRREKSGRRSREVGSIVKAHRGRVVLRTRAGGERIIDMLPGEQMPRIC